jgi:hypothetical protein
MRSFFAGLTAFGMILVIIAIIIGLFMVCPYVFMLLWNWLVPLFWAAAPILTFWQSVGIIILLAIVGSFFKK